MAASGHFGCSKITFDLISGHFRSIRNFIFCWFFLTKWLPAGILDVRISLSIAFLAISDRYAILIYFWIFLTKWLPAAILDVQNSLSIAFLAISDRSAILDFRNSLSIAILAISDRCRFIFSAAILDVWNSFRSHFWPFQIDTQFFFWQNGRRRPFWMGRQCQLSNSSEIFGWVMHVSSLKNVI